MTTLLKRIERVDRLLAVREVRPLDEQAERARDSLREFIQQAWPVVEPRTPFVAGWHIDAICEHLEAVANGEIRNLLINMPPRHMKSLTVSVFWPCWEWLQHPERRWLYSSYALSLAIRDSLKCRRLILSPWYQRNFGHVFRLTGDQNAKMRFENDKTGYRLSTSVGGAATGEGGDRIVCDDPHNVKEAESETIREATLTWWDEVMSTRLNDPKSSAKVIVMQRVHENDLSGHVLAQGGYEHLCLPAEYEGDVCATSIGWIDPRTEPGELLWPERVGPEEIADIKTRLGTYGYAGQFQQRPSPKAGGLFKRSWWQRYQGCDLAQAEQVIQVWDTAFQEKTTADYSVCSTWAQMPDGIYVLDVFRARLEFPDLKRTAVDLYRRWRPVVVLIEDKASGQSLIQELSRPDKQGRVTRLPIIPVKADRDKISRAAAVTPFVEAGMVHLPADGPWVNEWIEEHAAFPNGAHDDQVDTTSMALARLMREGEAFIAAVSGFGARFTSSADADPWQQVAHLRQQAAATAAEQEEAGSDAENDLDDSEEVAVAVASLRGYGGMPTRDQLFKRIVDHARRM